jgi:hypothetical protein
LLFLFRVVRFLFLQEALQRGDGDLGLRGGHVGQWWIIRVSTVVGSSRWINFLSPLSYVLYWSWRVGEGRNDLIAWQGQSSSWLNKGALFR